MQILAFKFVICWLVSLCVCLQHLQRTAQYEKKQKEMKNLFVEEAQVKRALAMKLDKECKLTMRRQTKRDTKEQHVQHVLGCLPS